MSEKIIDTAEQTAEAAAQGGKEKARRAEEACRQRQLLRLSRADHDGRDPARAPSIAAAGRKSLTPSPL